MPKKGKGKQVGYETDQATLAKFGVQVRDIISTPLGVRGTVLGVRGGVLWLRWPGGVESPTMAEAVDKAGLEQYGYMRRPQSAHIQRSITERQEAYFQQRWYGKPGPRTAAIKLPTPPGSAAFVAFTSKDRRPGTAPA